MTLEARLRGIVGSAQVLQGGDLSAYEVDWRKRWRGRARLVVRPGSTEEVAAVVRACAEFGASVVPQGGNTGLVGGGVPDESGTQVLVHLGRLNRVREVDAANLTLTVEAGCLLQNVQDAAEAQGLLFPLSLAAEGSCTIGGNLATNAGGTQVLRYGNARELCLGLEVVTADGEIWNGLSGLRKDNTGYDLRDLFIGSEGTLGLITAATLKLYPLPAVTATALASLDWLDAAVEFLGLAQARLGASLTGFEVMNRFSLELVRRHFPQLAQPLPASGWTVLLEQSGHDSEAQAQQRPCGRRGSASPRPAPWATGCGRYCSCVSVLDAPVFARADDPLGAFCHRTPAHPGMPRHRNGGGARRCSGDRCLGRFLASCGRVWRPSPRGVALWPRGIPMSDMSTPPQALVRQAASSAPPGSTRSPSTRTWATPRRSRTRSPTWMRASLVSSK